jgi:hypothetical protein
MRRTDVKPRRSLSACVFAAIALLAAPGSERTTGLGSPGICPGCVRVDIAFAAADRVSSFHGQSVCRSLSECRVPVAISVYRQRHAYEMAFRMEPGQSPIVLSRPIDAPMTSPSLFVDALNARAIPIADNVHGGGEMTFRIRAPERASAGGFLPAGIHYLVVRKPDPTDLGSLTVRVSAVE